MRKERKEERERRGERGGVRENEDMRSKEERCGR